MAFVIHFSDIYSPAAETSQQHAQQHGNNFFSKTFTRMTVWINDNQKNTNGMRGSERRSVSLHSRGRREQSLLFHCSVNKMSVKLGQN